MANEAASSADATSKKAKPRSLPPPGEAFTTWENDVSMKHRKRGRPAKVVKRETKIVHPKGRGGQGPDSLGERGLFAPETAPGQRQRKKNSSIWSYLTDSAALGPSKPKQESVLIRPTERTRLAKEKVATAGSVSASETTTVRGAGEDISPIFSLAAETRKQIWVYCVVDKNCFVWPRLKTGAEQPDLAMTCRQIRNEVLPIYYRHNWFAIDVSLPAELALANYKTTTVSQTASFQDLAKFQKWAKVLQGEGWFAKIKSWVFDFTILGGHGLSLMVFIRFKTSSETTWVVDIVEVHQDAHCVLPSSATFGKCKTQKLPDQLEQAVASVANEADHTGLPVRSLVKLMRTIISTAKDLVVCRRETVADGVDDDPKAGS